MFVDWDERDFIFQRSFDINSRLSSELPVSMKATPMLPLPINLLTTFRE